MSDLGLLIKSQTQLSYLLGLIDGRHSEHRPMLDSAWDLLDALEERLSHDR